MTPTFPTAHPSGRSAVALLAGLQALGSLPSPLQAQTGLSAPALAPISQLRDNALSPAEARAIAKEAWLYAYAPHQAGKAP